METKYTKEQLLVLSNEEIKDKTNKRAVDIYMYDGRFAQLCANDFQGFDKERKYFYSKTGIKIEFQKVDCIKVIE
jgi:hypothetical protein